MGNFVAFLQSKYAHAAILALAAAAPVFFQSIGTPEPAVVSMLLGLLTSGVLVHLISTT